MATPGPMATAALGGLLAVGAAHGGGGERRRFGLAQEGRHHGHESGGDEKLALPRLAPLTFGAEGECRRRLGGLRQLTVRAGLAHRDDSEIAHDNTGVLDGGDVSVSLAPTESLRLTLYGRNLLGEVFRRSHFDLTGLVESTCSPLKEGRVGGVEVRWRLR